MRVLAEADVIAHFAKAGNASHSRDIVAPVPARRRHRAAAALSGHHRTADVQQPAIATPSRIFTTAPPQQIAAHLEAGRTVARDLRGRSAVLRLLHASARAAGAALPAEIVAGVTGMSGCWSAAGMPIAQGDDVFTVLPATLPEDELGAPARRCRRRGGDEGRPASAEAAPRARHAAAGCSAPSMSSAAPWRTRR